MIKSVKKIHEGKYVINDCVFISDLDITDNGLGCNIAYDPAMTTETEANQLAETFLSEAIDDIAKNL
jgi:hypothetical protein